MFAIRKNEFMQLFALQCPLKLLQVQGCNHFIGHNHQIACLDMPIKQGSVCNQTCTNDDWIAAFTQIDTERLWLLFNPVHRLVCQLGWMGSNVIH